MACSPAQLLANQLNAMKSTGPRTRAGKRKASLNAKTHGFYCAHAVVQGENEDSFHLMRETLLFEYAPQDTQELLMVDQIVLCHWKLRRLQLSEQEFFAGHAQTLKERVNESVERDDLEDACDAADALHLPHFAANVMAVDMAQTHSVIERYSRLEQRLMNSIYRAIRELRTLRKMKGITSEELPLSPFLDPERMAKVRAEAMEELTKQEQPSEDTGETPVVQEEQEPDSAPVTRSSRPCSELEDQEELESAEPSLPVRTGETPVSRGSVARSRNGAPRDTSNVRNEPNPDLANVRNEANPGQEAVEATSDTSPAGGVGV